MPCGKCLHQIINIGEGVHHTPVQNYGNVFEWYYFPERLNILVQVVHGINIGKVPDVACSALFLPAFKCKIRNIWGYHRLGDALPLQNLCG